MTTNLLFNKDCSVPPEAKDKEELVIAQQHLGGKRENGWILGVTRGNVLVVKITMGA